MVGTEKAEIHLGEGAVYREQDHSNELLYCGCMHW